MVIQCPECSTKFRVSAEKIPAQGAKLRCARCRHIFLVKPEEEVAPPPVTEETSATAIPAEESYTAPGPSFEEPAAASDEDSFAFDEPSSESDFAEESFDTSADDAFGDTEFNFDEPAKEDSLSSADAFPSEEPISDNIDFGFEEETTATSKTADATEDMFGFGDTEESDKPEIGAGVNDEFDMSAFEGDSTTTDDAFSFDEDYGNVEIGAEEEDDDEPFSFGDEPPAPQASYASPEPQSEEFPPPEEPAGTPPFAESSPEEHTDEPFRPIDEDSYGESVPAQRPAKKRGPFSVLILFLLILIIGLVAAGGVLYWQSGPEGLLKMYQRITGQQVATPVQGQILVKNLQGSFMTNTSAGELLVIKGEAINDYRESRAAIQVKGILFDNQGKQLRQKTIFCGNPISQEDLRSLPYDKLEEIMGNQFGESLVNLNVTPGQVIPFTIVFRDIPKNLSEFVVEVAGSNPAAQ